MVGFVYIELSTISAFSVDGSTSDTRTFRDSGPQRGRFRFGLRTVRDTYPQRGRFRSGPRTVHDIDRHRGRFALWYLNHPRYEAVSAPYLAILQS